MKELSMKLKQFDFLSVEHVAIQINEFKYTDGDEQGSAYNVSLVLWLDRDEKKPMPVVMHTELYGDSAFEAAYKAYQTALPMFGKLANPVIVIDEEGDLVDEFLLDEVLKEFECTETPENTPETH